MTWLTPLTGLLLGAAVLPPLILLYFLKLRRRTHPIACTILWQRSVEDLQANSPFQRLRKNLLLLLQLLVLTLLALSVAQPRLEGGFKSGGKVVIMIDNSASMTATDLEDGKSRLEEAKDQARDLIETRYAGGIFSDSPGETMVIAFNNQAEIMCRFTDSKQQLLSAIDRIPATHTTTRIDQALKLARAHLINPDPDNVEMSLGEPATLELYSDGRIEDLVDQVLRGETLRFYPIGTEDADNIAITSISVERPYDQPTTVQVFVALTNFRKEAISADVQLSVDDVAVSIQGVDVEPARLADDDKTLLAGGSNVVFSPFELARGAVIEVAVLRPDAVAADNVAQAIVAPPKRLRVLLIAPTNNLIQTTLEGMALEELKRERTGELFDRLVEEDRVDQYDVVVIDGYEPEKLSAGRYLIFGKPPPVEGLNPFGEGENQVVLDARDEHPLLKYVSLDNLFVSSFHLIEPADDVRVLAEGNASPLVVSISRGPLQIIYVPFDPLDSNWPFYRGWVNFLANAVDTLGHSGSGLTSRGFEPGDALTARLPATARDVTLQTPEMTTPQPLEPFDPTMFSWGPALTVGIYDLSWDEPGLEDRSRMPMAVNLLSNREADVRVTEEIRIGQDTTAASSAEDASYTPLWPWAVGLCLVILMFEWWVYHRKTFI
jgi:hypothetical protein